MNFVHLLCSEDWRRAVRLVSAESDEYEPTAPEPDQWAVVRWFQPGICSLKILLILLL